LQWFEFTINSMLLKVTPSTSNGIPRPQILNGRVQLRSMIVLGESKFKLL